MPANGLCQSAFRQRAQLWVCVSVCPWVVGVAIAPALPLSVPLVLAWPDLSFYLTLFDPLPSLLAVPLPRSLLPNPSPPFSATPPSPPLISECPPVHLPCFPFSPNPHLTSLLPPFFLFLGGNWSYCFNPLSLPPFPSQSTPFSCFTPIPFLTALGKLVDLVSPDTHNDLQAVVQATADTAVPIPSFQ